MNKTWKYILIGGLVLGLIAILAFSTILKGLEVGTVLATLAGGFAAFKSKIFKSSSSVEDQIALVEQEHSVKREDWKNMKVEYESKFNALKARMDFIDYKSAKILQEISDLDEIQKRALKNDANLSNDQLLDFLNQ
jgi:hypothetical protein